MTTRDGIAAVVADSKTPPPPPQAQSAMEESRWKLPSGVAVLLHPQNLTARDFEVLRGQIKLLELSADPPFRKD